MTTTERAKKAVDAYLKEAARYELFGDTQQAAFHFHKALQWDKILVPDQSTEAKGK